MCTHFQDCRIKVVLKKYLDTIHGVRNVRIQSFSGQYFPALGPNAEREGVSLRIQSKCGKIRTRKPPKTSKYFSRSGNVNISIEISIRK